MHKAEDAWVVWVFMCENLKELCFTANPIRVVYWIQCVLIARTKIHETLCAKKNICAALTLFCQPEPINLSLYLLKLKKKFKQIYQLNIKLFGLRVI